MPKKKKTKKVKKVKILKKSKIIKIKTKNKSDLKSDRKSVV